MVELKNVSCRNCGGNYSREVYPDELQGQTPPVGYDFSPLTRKTFRIVKCRDCDLVFTNPMPSLESAYVDNVDEYYMASQAQRRRTAAKSAEMIRKIQPNGRLLDVGCAIGLFLDAATPTYSVEGIELSGWAATIAAERHKVHRQPLATLDFDTEFDIITLWGVIEHMENPREEMAAAFRALKPGGLLVVYTGDVDAWLSRLLGKSWWWFQGMHLIYFSARTLTDMLHRVGFKVFKQETLPVYFQLFSLGQSLNRYFIGKLFMPIFNLPILRNIMIPLRLSGEMVLFARKPEELT